MIQIKSDTNMSLSATYLTLLVIICVCLLTNKQMVASKAAIGADSDDAVINLFVENAEDIDVIINVVQLPATENCDCENCTCEGIYFNKLLVLLRKIFWFYKSYSFDVF